MKKSLLGFALLAATALGAALMLQSEPALPESTPPGPEAARSDVTPATAAVAEVSPPASRNVATAPATHTEAAQGVRGRVLDARGTPLPGAEVFLVESASYDPIQRFVHLSHGMPLLASAAARTDERGEFRLGVRAADERSHEIGVRASDHANARIGDLRVHPGEWIDVGDILLTPGARIRGRVTVEGTDLPVPAATVRLECGDPFFDVGPAQLAEWRRQHTATVDGNGRYELRDAPREGTFRLLASAPGFGRSIRDGVQLDGTAPVELDFALPRGQSIGGRLDTGGGPLGAVRIEAFSKRAEPAFEATVGAEGRFYVHGLRDGPHLLKIAAEGYRAVDLPDVAAGSEDLIVPLVARARARLSVFDADGGLLRHYRLALRRYDAATGQIGLANDVPDRVVVLDGDERETLITGLDDGDYAFQVEAEGAASSLSPPFTIDATHRDVAVHMQTHRGGRLVGLVVDADGRPVAGATVATQPHGASDENPMLRALGVLLPDRITRATATTDSAGRFALSRLAHADYQLAVEHPHHCRSVRTAIAVTGDGTVELAPLVLLRGTLVRGRALLDGVPTGQVLVVLGPDPLAADTETGPLEKTRDETRVRRVEAVTNSTGSFELPRRVPPGTYELRGALQLGNGPDSDPFRRLLQLQRSAMRITVLPGQEAAEFDLQLASAH